HTATMLELEGVIEIRLSGEFIFINQTRLRLGLDNFAAFSGLVTMLRDSGVGVLRISDGVTRREWQAFLSLLHELPSSDLPVDRFEQLSARRARADIANIEIDVGGDTDARSDGEDEALARAKRTYAHGVSAAREVVNGVRMGRAPNTRRLKRAVQLLVDQ